MPESGAAIAYPCDRYGPFHIDCYKKVNREHASNRRERLIEIGNEVGRVLEANRQAHQAVVDAERGALLRLEAVMGGGGGVRDQALAVSEVVRDQDEPERILETERALLATRHRERHHRAAAAHLPRRERVLRMAFEAGIEHARHLAVALEMLRDLERRSRLPLDPEIERLDALEQQPGVERAQGRAGVP